MTPATASGDLRRRIENAMFVEAGPDSDLRIEKKWREVKQVDIKYFP